MIYAGYLVATSGLLLSCTALQDAAASQAIERPHTQPEIDRDALNLIVSDIEAGGFGNIHSLLVSKRGNVALEAYFSGEDRIIGHGSIGSVKFGPERLHDVRSVGKSIVSLLVGIAIDRGQIPSVQTPIADLLPEYASLFDEQKRSITVHHLLTMQAGLKWSEGTFEESSDDEIRMNRSSDPLQYILTRPMAANPGTTFNYNTGLTQLLIGILEARTGERIEQFANQHLFSPLDIRHFEWRRNPASAQRYASGLRLTAPDMLKIGQLAESDGMWRGRQIVSSEWTKKALRSHVDEPVPEDLRHRVLRGGYGYQWWNDEHVIPGGSIRMSYAQGNGGQKIFVVPEYELVVVTLAGTYGESTWAPEDLLLRIVAATR